MLITARSAPAALSRVETPLRVSNALVGLTALIALLALVAAGVSLFWMPGGGPVTVTSLRGESVQIYGRGIYSFDSIFTATTNLGTDCLTLLFGIPLLLVTTLRYRRGSLRGGLLLLGTLFYFLYVYAGHAAGLAYNPLFLLYIALFSASLFAFVLAFSAIDPRRLAAHISVRMPRRGISSFMIASGLVTTIVWLGPLLGSIMRGEPPARLGVASTEVTYVLDLGIITPATIISGLLILRGNGLGYIIAFALIVLELLLAPMIIAQTIFQLAGGIVLSPGEIIGPTCGFIVLGLIALWATVAMLRNTSEDLW
jgi:hypothetical protein